MFNSKTRYPLFCHSFKNKKRVNFWFTLFGIYCFGRLICAKFSFNFFQLSRFINA